jgi:hypothetical protein
MHCYTTESTLTEWTWARRCEAAVNSRSNFGQHMQWHAWTQPQARRLPAVWLGVRSEAGIPGPQMTKIPRQQHPSPSNKKRLNVHPRPRTIVPAEDPRTPNLGIFKVPIRFARSWTCAATVRPC